MKKIVKINVPETQQRRRSNGRKHPAKGLSYASRFPDGDSMSKQSKPSSPNAVRMRRAYFDCEAGQLHVRTAFPATGGFDEQVTLFCLHPSEGSSRIFSRFLLEIADQRSVYAPDLPGFGESDPPIDGTSTIRCSVAARIISTLATDLRLRRIDLFGVGLGAAVALELAAARADLVRRLVLMKIPPMDGIPPVKQESLVLRTKLGVADESHFSNGVAPSAQFVDLDDPAADPLASAPVTLARQIAAFLEN
jgi:pimeloyl-ACP methyl ester carboxylesterase